VSMLMRQNRCHPVANGSRDQTCQCKAAGARNLWGDATTGRGFFYGAYRLVAGITAAASVDRVCPADGGFHASQGVGADPTHPGGEALGLSIPYSHYPLVYLVKIVLTMTAVAAVWPSFREFPFGVTLLAIVVG